MYQDVKNIYHWLVAWGSHAWYGFPARKLKLIGITGTDGKTTTASLIYHVLKTAGKKVSVITTVSATIGGQSHDTGFHVTTPDPHHIPRYLSAAVKHGDEYMVFEITSHGLHQHRAAPMRFELSGITNITHEHLDYHLTMERYIAAKATLARLSRKTYVNGDQPDVAAKIRRYAPDAQIETFGLPNRALSHVEWERNIPSHGGGSFTPVQDDRGKVDHKIDITEKFSVYLETYNKYNFLLAYLICRDLGISDVQYKAAIDTYTFPPGRMETIYDEDFTVIIDFAHTPNGIGQALAAIAEKYPGRRIIHVFGSAGKRDIAKRPPMGEASGTYATKVILTEEDCRDEDPTAICEMIATGLEKQGFRKILNKNTVCNDPSLKTKEYIIIPDRTEAIRYAVSEAQKGDVIVATGKAHETTLCRGTTEYPYSEKEAFALAKPPEHDECAKEGQEGTEPEGELDRGGIINE